MQTFSRIAHLVLIMMLLGMILALTGCGKTDENGQVLGRKEDKAAGQASAPGLPADSKPEPGAGQGKAGQDATEGQGAGQGAGQGMGRGPTNDAIAAARDRAGEISSVVDDSAITASVKADLLKDPKLSVSKVDVSTEKGEVTLTGKVDDEASRQRASEVAAAVSGVHKVNNELQVAAAGKPKGAGAPA
jgi:hypothetical protein